MGFRKKIFFIFFAFLLLFFSSVKILQAKEENIVPTPIVVKTEILRGINGLGEFKISGLTLKNTEVLVYVDGIYFGQAEVKSEKTETDNFFYKNEKILSEGNYEVLVISRDKTSLLLSPEVRINIEIPELSAPTLIAPNEQNVVGVKKPLITGLTISNTSVYVFIDGIYNGKTEVLKDESGTANFAYRPFLNLAKGDHRVWAFAKDENGKETLISNVLNFKIEDPMPAPVLFNPEIKVEKNKPFIVGVAKNNSIVKIYVDHKFFGQFEVKNNESGTANFFYKTPELSRGNHLVYATATDKRGKESSWSNIIYFNIKYPEISSLSAQEEETENVSKIIKEENEEAEPLVNISEENGGVDNDSNNETVENNNEEIIKIDEKNDDQNDNQNKVEENKNNDEDLRKILEGKINEEDSVNETGLINEEKESQGKLKLNLIIFIAFLFGVIAWIFWVNKELIKERRKKQEEENSSEQKEEDNK